jgi:tyrosine-protein kinase Etk/Wzc
MKKEAHLSRHQEKKVDLEYVDVKKLLTTLLEKKWKIIITSFGFAILAFVFCFFRLPTYNTSLLINLNASKGSGSLSSVVSKIVPILSSDDSNNDQQTVIIKSYSVLEPVVKNLRLDIIAEPKYFPIIGKLFYYNFTDDGSTKDGFADPILGMSSFAWGGERIRVDKFDVPNSMKNDRFILTYLGDNKFTLADSDGNQIITGNTNTNLKYQYYKGQVEINVAEIKARPGKKFKLTQLVMDDAIAIVLTKLNVTNAGKKADLITLSYKGKSPNNIATILNAIAESAVQQDVNQKQEQAKKTLEFLRQHEPKVRAELSQAESILHEYRAKSGNVALDQETKITMENMAFLQSQISQLLIQKGQIEQKYTDNSLQIKDVNTTLEKLSQEKNKVEKKLKELPNADQIALNLMRNVDIQNQIYVNLVEKIQQFELLKAGTVGDLSIVSYAYVPLKSADAPSQTIIAISFIIGGILSAGIILIRKLMWVGIENPDIVENKFNIPCLATLNNSKIQKKQVMDLEKKRIKHFKFLAEIDSYDLTVEGLRSLRTNLSFQYQEKNNHIIVFSSPTPGVGKSFLSANFSYILAEVGKKVLLIDGDLRRGSLNNYFDSNICPNGLSDVLANKVKVEDVIQKTRIENLDFLPRGNYLDKITSIIQSGNIEKLLIDISIPYDYVIIDTAPVLSVSDAIHFCKYSSIPIMVFGYESHDEKEIEASIKKFEISRVNLNGFIFNKVSEKQSYFGNKYDYKYREYKA